jgi:SAM-dependent methyltransferase
MLEKAIYANQGHYLSEAWSVEPKEIFQALARLVLDRKGNQCRSLLDVGCATGELLGHLASHLPGARLVGVDVADQALAEARRLLPGATFVAASALALPAAYGAAFDVVTAVGCMSIFDETEIGSFWDNLFRVTRPGGLIVVLSPLNEYGVDTMIRHRKRLGGMPPRWETGWNIFSRETIAELVAERGGTLDLQRFQISRDLPPREDPVRTWTIRTTDRDRQLINGLKLLVDHYFMIVGTPQAPSGTKAEAS